MSNPTPEDNRAGIAAMMAAMACFVVNDTLVKIATASLPTGHVLAIRGAFATLLVFAWIAASGLLHRLGGVTRPLVLLRAGIEGLVAAVFIAALAHLPIADITAIFLISPLLITALSTIFLKEQVGWRRWTAVIAGFIGVLFVVKPFGGGVGWPALLALASAVLVAARDLVTRRIEGDVHTLIVTASTCMAVTLIGLLMVPFERSVVVAAPDVAILAAASVAVVIGNNRIIRAFRDVDVSAVSPFRYSVIVFAIVSGVVVFGEWPDLPASFGIALIVGAGLYALHREGVRRREAAGPR